MISFIISTYNRPTRLAGLLYSLLAQTSREWEAIIMDEGANQHVAACLYDRRISWYSIDRETPMGPNGSYGLLPKHAGVRYAKGDKVCFPSDDIYYLPQFVAMMGGHDEDIVGCDLLINSAEYGSYILHWQPRVNFTDSANYAIKPEVYARHPFTEWIPGHTGYADGLTAQECVRDGASCRRIERTLVVHGDERA